MTPSQQHIGTPALIRRFAPYLMRYKRILIFRFVLCRTDHFV